MTAHAHVDVEGRVNGADGASIEIDRDRQVLHVRPHRERRLYTIELVRLCEMVVARVVKDEMGKDLEQGIAPRKGGRAR